MDLESPLPAWVPELAEAVGGRKFNEEGLLVQPDKSIVELRSELLALKGDDFWSRFGRWFFMRGPNGRSVQTRRSPSASSRRYGMTAVYTGTGSFRGQRAESQGLPQRGNAG